MSGGVIVFTRGTNEQRGYLTILAEHEKAALISRDNAFKVIAQFTRRSSLFVDTS